MLRYSRKRRIRRRRPIRGPVSRFRKTKKKEWFSRAAIILGGLLILMAIGRYVVRWQSERSFVNLLAPQARTQFYHLSPEIRQKFRQRENHFVEKLDKAGREFMITDLVRQLDENIPMALYRLTLGESHLLGCRLIEVDNRIEAQAGGFNYSVTHDNGALVQRQHELPLRMDSIDQDFAFSPDLQRLPIGAQGVLLEGLVQINAQDVRLKEAKLIVPGLWDPESLSDLDLDSDEFSLKNPLL